MKREKKAGQSTAPPQTPAPPPDVVPMDQPAKERFAEIVESLAGAMANVGRPPVSTKAADVVDVTPAMGERKPSKRVYVCPQCGAHSMIERG